MDTKRLRQRVLDLAIHGKLVPQNPQDEPASELLKRITKEKEKLVKEGKIKKSKKKDNEDIDEVPFEVPQGWVWCRLGDIACFFNGDRSKNYPNKEEYVSNGIAWINTGHILPNGYLSEANMNYITENKYNSLSSGKIQKGDLVYCLRGATYGKISRVEPFSKGAVASSLMIIRAINIELKEYIYYYLKSHFSKEILLSYANGAAQPNLAANDVAKFTFPLPPLAEQHRIVSEVEKYFSLIDILEESENDLQQSIQKAKSKILDLAIKGKLVEQDENDEPAYILLERIKEEKNQLIKEKKIKKEKALAEITEEEKFFEIPKNWIWCRWGDLSFSIQYGYNAPAQDSGEIRMVRISDIQNNEVLWDTVPFCNIKKDEIDGYLLQPNDILFARTGGTVGKSFLVESVPYPSIYAGYLIRTRYSHDLVPKYLKYFMESHLYWEQLRDGTIATAQPNCNGKTLGNMILPLPPLAEQHRIVEKVETIFTQLDNIAEALK